MECKGTGRVRITGCPNKQIDHATAEAFFAASTLKNGGGWPNTRGGWMDEPRGLVDAIRMIHSEEARHMARAIKGGT